MEKPPHAMRLGDSEKDYYVGALTNPGTSAGAEQSPMGPGRYELAEHPGVDFPGAEQQAQRAAQAAGDGLGSPEPPSRSGPDPEPKQEVRP
jgi:NADH-quinone oxidoreductase subunit I